MLPSDHNWSFVCVLSSINLLHYDKWKNTDAIETMIYFLDTLVTEFIEKLDRYKNSLIEMTNRHFYSWKERIILQKKIELLEWEF